MLYLNNRKSTGDTEISMKRSSRILNAGYANIFAAYWMFYGVANAFASAYLLPKGYTNAEIGIILAVGSVLAIFLQPIMADIADRSKKLSLLGVTQLSAGLLIVLEATLFAMAHKSLALWVVFVMIIAWLTALQPLFNSLAFHLEESGVHIHFGVCRGMGSLGFALLTAVLGTFVEMWGANILPAVGELTLAGLLVTIIIVKREFEGCVKMKAQARSVGVDTGAGGDAEVPLPLPLDSVDKQEEINLWRFIHDNKLFLILNIGVIGLYFSNAVLNNFMLQIVNAVGGTSEDMGRVLAVMAFMEMPALFFFDKVKVRFSCQTLLKVAAVGFTLRVALIFLAKSMTVIYLAHIFQTLGFALFLPAMVVFIGDVMRRGEAVKGQAFFTAMTTVAAMISSVLGGIMLDVRDAHFMLLVSTLVTAAGALVIIIVVGKIRKQV
jgi:PPP family 3-phenylpropionic acid transporter